MKWLKKSDKEEIKDEVATQLALADRVARRVIHSSSAQEVAKGTIEDLMDYMSIDWAVLSLIDVILNKVILQSLTPVDHDEISIPLMGTAIDWVSKEKQALLQNDIQDHTSLIQPISSDPELKVIVHMPLFYHGDVYGVISVGTHNTTPYADSQLRLLKHAVAHLAVSIKSALLLAQNLKTEASLADLNELLTIFTSKSEIKELFGEFAERLNQVIVLDRLNLFVIEGNVLRPLAIAEKSACYQEDGSWVCQQESYPSMDDFVSIEDTAIPWMSKNKKMSVEVDMFKKKQFAIDKHYLKDQYRGAIRLPLYAHGKLFACLEMLSSLPYTIKGKEGFLKQLANYLATPVESYLLYLYENQRISWLAALAHHLRTPLTPLSASSQMLVGQLAKADDPKLLKLANSISAGAENLKDNLALFWDISDVESAAFGLNFDIINPKKLVESAVAQMASAATNKSQNITVDLPQSLPDVNADEARIQQVLTALLGNAIEVSATSSQIGLKASADGKEVIVAVSDSGQVLTDEEIASLLKPYSFSESDMRSFPKLTLKLAVCIKLVKLHGGRIWIEGRPEGGNTFYFSIPVAK